MSLTAQEVLTTTRAVRKRLDFDRPVDLSLVKECLEIALQTPTGSNMQTWHFVVVTDKEKIGKIAELYKRAWEIYRPMPISAHNLQQPTEDLQASQVRVADSAQYLADNVQRVPMMVIPCMAGRVEHFGEPNNFLNATLYGSVLPAVWNFMLAARMRGLGTAWTSLHLMFEQEAAAILGIPYEAITQVCMTPVAYTIGSEFKPAARKSVDEILHINGW